MAIYQGIWSHVCAFVPLAENIVNNYDEELKNNEHGQSQSSNSVRFTDTSSITAHSVAVARTELAIALGLAKLSSFNFKEAACYFLQVRMLVLIKMLY